MPLIDMLVLTITTVGALEGCLEGCEIWLVICRKKATLCIYAWLETFLPSRAALVYNKQATFGTRGPDCESIDPFKSFRMGWQKAKDGGRHHYGPEASKLQEACFCGGQCTVKIISCTSALCFHS